MCIVIMELNELLGLNKFQNQLNIANIANKNITTNIYRIQAYDSIMCEYICIVFIDFMLKGKSVIDYTNLFSPNEYKKNDKIIQKYFQ